MKYSLRELIEPGYYVMKNFYDQPLDDNNKERFRAFIEKYICQDFILFLKLIGMKIFEEFMEIAALKKEVS